MQFVFPGNNPEEILPFGGSARYFSGVIEQDLADLFFRSLQKEIQWQHDVVRLYGKTIVTKREVAWYGDRPYAYAYSNTEKVALRWTPDLLRIKSMVEQCCGEHFNACLLNRYHSGEEGMSWHSDDEASLAPDAPIASVSFGATRKFSFRETESKQTVSVMLEHGSLLLMDASSQRLWQHALPKSTRVKEERVNLTFRRMKDV